MEKIISKLIEKYNIKTNLILKKKHGSNPEITAVSFLTSALESKSPEDMASMLGTSLSTLKRRSPQMYKLCGIPEKLSAGISWKEHIIQLVGVSSTCRDCKVELIEGTWCTECKALYHKNYYLENKNKCLANSKRHYNENKDSYKVRDSVRSARLKDATPSWANLYEIGIFYLNRPIGYHVDHVVPIKNNLVCGLHVLDNLQYLTAEANLAKSNKFTV
jgi:hypothetical protein